ncbi:20168_t:CDS:10, partial [Dentiscutata erythropus]
LHVKRKRQKIKLKEARNELHADWIIFVNAEKHKLETLQNASNQVLDFQTKLTEELSKERLSEPTVVPDQTLKSNDDQNINRNDDQAMEEGCNSSSFVEGKDTANSFLSDEEGETESAEGANVLLTEELSKECLSEPTVVPDQPLKTMEEGFNSSSFVKGKDTANSFLSDKERETESAEGKNVLSTKSTVAPATLLGQMNMSSDEQVIKDSFALPGPKKKDAANPFFSDDEERVIRYYEGQKNQSLSSKGNVLPNGNKIERPAPLNLVPSDEENDSSQGINEDDDEGIPSEESIDSAFNDPRIWMLPSGRNVTDIYFEKISENASAIKNKKLTMIEKAILRYGASNIIDLSAHMKSWFSTDDKRFMMKNYESMLRIPELALEESTFVLQVEEMVLKGEVNQAKKYCSEIHFKSEENSYLYKLSKIYGDLCDVRFLSMLGVNVGEWEFSAKITAAKIIGDSWGHLRAFFATSGQLLIENLVERFYIVFPGSKFELPTKLRDIRKLKTSINIIKLVMIIDSLETTHHEFEDIFSEDEIKITKPIHYKYKYVRKPWWTPKSKNHNR